MVTTVPNIGSDPITREVILRYHIDYEMNLWRRSYLKIPKEKFMIKLEDPIYNVIEITPAVSNLLLSSIFLRTSNIKQLSSSRYINNGATHTRFAHSLGVSFISSKIYANIIRSDEIKDKLIELLDKRIKAHWRSVLGDSNKIETIIKEYKKDIYILFENLGKELISMATLLHDIGHGGWGHIMDGLNGLIFRFIKESLKYPGGSARLPLTPALLEVRKLDITSASYIVSNNEQIINYINQGLLDLLLSIKDKLGKKIVNIIYKLIHINAFVTFIVSIITEDMSLLTKEGKLYPIAITWYAEIQPRNDDEKILFTIVVESLFIISMLGILILGDITVNDEVMGFNADRLDWIRRDSYHLGRCNNGNNSDFCKKLRNLEKIINDIILSENLADNVEITINDEDLTLYLRTINKLQKLHDNIKLLRNKLYELYHDNLKAIYDSLLLRSAYASVRLIRDVVLYNINHSAATRSAIAHIMNNDDLFVSNTLDILKSLINLKSLFIIYISNLIKSYQIDDIDNIFDKCNTECTYAINTLYMLNSANDELLTLLHQPYLLVHLNTITDIDDTNIYGPIVLEEPGYAPDKLIYILEIKLKSLENSLIKLLENEELIDVYHENISEILNSMSQCLESLFVPILEYVLNNKYKSKLDASHIYVNYVHYGLKDLSNNLNSSKIGRIKERPIIYMFMSIPLGVYKYKKSKLYGEQSIERHSQSQLYVNELIKKHLELMNKHIKYIKNDIDRWMSHVIIENTLSQDLRDLIEEIFSA